MESSLTFNYVLTIADYRLAIAALSLFDRLALDSETYTIQQYESTVGDKGRLSPHTGRISLLTLVGESSLPYVFDLIVLEHLDYDPQPLLNLLRTREYILAHHAKFDLLMLMGHFKYQFTNVRCTLTLAQLYANATGSKLARVRKLSLEALCRDWLGRFMTGKGSVQLTDWYTSVSARTLDNPQWVEKLHYAAVDVINLLELHDLLNSILCLPLPSSPYIEETEREEGEEQGYGYGMANVVDVEMRFINVAAEIQFNGLPASSYVLNQLLDAVVTEKMRAAQSFCHTVGLPTLLLSPFDDYESPSPSSLKSLNSPAQLKSILTNLTDLELTSTQSGLIERTLKVLQAYAEHNKKSDDNEGGDDDDDEHTVPIELIEGEEDLYGLLEDIESEKLGKLASVLNELITYKRLTKLESMNLAAYINPVTGCIHGNTNAIGTSTGRSSSSKPNIQQISSKNKVVVELDVDILFKSDCKIDTLAFNYE